MKASTARKRLSMALMTVVLLFTVASFSHARGADERTGLLRIGLMPAVNAAPLVVADEAGFFRDEGVAVELVMFNNQLYRESALQTHAIDGSISDLINAVSSRAAGFDIRVTSASEGLFAVLAAPQSPHRSLADWAQQSVRVGLLENSIVNYITERLTERAGVPTHRIELVPSAQLPARLEMLLAGRLEAACLPEPMIRLALAGGAHLLADSRELPFTPGVILFTGRAAVEKEGLIQAFYRAYNRAVAELAEGEAHWRRPWRERLVERCDFPAATARDVVLPVFAPARPTSRAEYDDVVSWMRAKGLLAGREVPAYETLVDASFLP